MRGGGSGARAERGSQGEGQDRHLDVLTRSGVLGGTTCQVLPKGLKKWGSGVRESHRGAARPFSSSEKRHLLQGTCVIERDKRMFHSVNRTKQSFWTHQKYFL